MRNLAQIDLLVIGAYLTLTFSGTLTYDQTVPAGNAGFPASNGTRSSSFAEMEIFTLNLDSIEAGITAEDNSAIFEGDRIQA